MIDQKHGWLLSIKPLYLALTLSIILLLSSYRIVIHSHLSGDALIYTLFILAIFQAICQLLFYMHLGMGESKPHWNLIAFLFMVLVLFIVIGGTLWIMKNIDYHMMLTIQPQESY